ncbi:hypothetical protein CH278_25750 [Rhodococcus sp. 05-2254-5]|uniref:hypothetical protein n=1 Tax=unclassified Rhodococcus (in: high G+C Gram-positive bacteria) TaxID=192944 RepID=UPI000B9B415E|nr:MULTISPECIES: hypothetical protein [unclassified Rhodococcus (in: high G+C Gram-positive bacteria)]OZE26966.1 hypothetical protein CH278_25750 [Rhodococcus sp. 05-2254-5]OZE58308.1 hypothetical protein CH269_10910 [Rhodococcus sp. 05-2254-1]
MQPHELGEVLSARRGIVGVELGNAKSTRRYEFDVAIANAADLEAVDGLLADLVENREVLPNTINDFFIRAQSFPTAHNYAGGIAEYLYWLAARSSASESEVSIRHKNKLNQAAHLLRDVRRPAADAITSLISFHSNHFDAASQRALSSHFRRVANRLETMLDDSPGITDPSKLSGYFVDVERLLMDERTASLVELCSLPLDRSTSENVASIDLGRSPTPDTFKIVLFSSEHHLATRDQRAEALIQSAGRYGLPEHWVNDRLDLITTEGFTWQTAPKKTAPRENTSIGQVPRTDCVDTVTPMSCSPEDDQEGQQVPRNHPSTPSTACRKNHATPASGQRSVAAGRQVREQMPQTHTSPRDSSASQKTNGSPSLHRILRHFPWRK